MVIADLVDTLSRIGAIGGILSIVGVGLLILLVASQNRQIRSMKEWIDEEPQRQAETAQRVIAEVQRRIAAARERRAQGSGGAAAAVPGGKAKPAPGTLGATPEAQKIAAAQELVGAAGAGAAAGSTPPPATGEEGGPRFAPLTPAGGAEDGDDEEADELGPGEPDQPAVVSEFLGQETQVADALPSEPPPALAGRTDDVRYGDDAYDLDAPPQSNRTLFGVGVAALVAGIVLAAVLLFGGGDDDPAANTAAGGNAGGEIQNEETTPATEASGPDTVDPSQVAVRVFNGTAITGLAGRVTDRAKAKGYPAETPGTYSSGTALQTSNVFYRQGMRDEGLRVARDLSLPTSTVKPITADVSANAGETAEVVVVTGADLDTGSGTE